MIKYEDDKKIFPNVVLMLMSINSELKTLYSENPVKMNQLWVEICD